MFDIRIILVAVMLLLSLLFLEFIKYRAMFYKIAIPKLSPEERKKKYNITIPTGIEIPLLTSKEYKARLRPFTMPYSVTTAQALRFIKDGKCIVATPSEIIEFLTKTQHSEKKSIIYYIQNSNVVCFIRIPDGIVVTMAYKIPKGAVILGVK